jgi:hypothetical protein
MEYGAAGWPRGPTDVRTHATEDMHLKEKARQWSAAEKYLVCCRKAARAHLLGASPHRSCTEGVRREQTVPATFTDHTICHRSYYLIIYLESVLLGRWLRPCTPRT